MTAFNRVATPGRIKRKTLSSASALILILAALICPQPAAADFQVQPTKLYLNAGEKSGAFSVINNGSEKIDFQISVKEWSQDEKGKEIYTDTAEIMFFPKIMTVEPNGQRAVRVGVKGPPPLKERTYRLFVEEIPTSRKVTDEKAAGKIKAGLTIAFRFAVPIFVAPVKPQQSVVIEKIEMAGGDVKALLRNTGNVHVKLLRIILSGKTADGRESYMKEIAGWYVLHGQAQTYEAAVPKEKCGDLKTIDVTAHAENLIVTGSMNVQPRMCAQ